MTATSSKPNDVTTTRGRVRAVAVSAAVVFMVAAVVLVPVLSFGVCPPWSVPCSWPHDLNEATAVMQRSFGQTRDVLMVGGWPPRMQLAVWLLAFGASVPAVCDFCRHRINSMQERRDQEDRR